MHASLLLAAAAAGAVLASPSYPVLAANDAAVADYFNLMASKVQASRQADAAPSCDLSAAVFPSNAATPALPPPSAGLVLKHVAIGRGTQNYTCDLANATAVPAAAGAVAALFNASCAAAAYPDLLDLLPRAALAFNFSDFDASSADDDSANSAAVAALLDGAAAARLFPTNLALAGHHFFTNTTTPFFDLADAAAGAASCAKNNSQPAPASSSAAAAAPNRGQLGEAAVPWLKLLARPGAATTTTAPGALQEVYRLQTVGGAAPASCAGMPAAFTVQYAAQYWFYASS